MTRIDIFSGFLGAGKTTLIKKLIKEGYENEQLVLIENEFGEIGIDGGFLKEAGIQINEMNSGCICCSLVGDFREALNKVLEQYHPDRILIEPSGVGKLSDVINAVKSVTSDDVILNSFITVADASKVKSYMKNFGEFFVNQIECAGTIILTRTDKTSQAKIAECVEILREHNPKATIITTPLAELDGKQILAVNGEIYNHMDIRARYKGRYDFTTGSDCEVILPLYRDKGMDFLEELKAEDNHIVRMWKQCGLDVENAGDSQALIQLKNVYCDRKDCLRCRFGYEYLRNV